MIDPSVGLAKFPACLDQSMPAKAGRLISSLRPQVWGGRFLFATSLDANQEG